ncbi:inositol monophosphatase [Patescibacteria group bacterium]|nr:MAG: inositol monophosphatase [Patescibacteria group bacterium]
MNDLRNEADFFNTIAPKIRQLVQSFHGKASISVQKAAADYATEVDIAVENLIVNEIETRFPGDSILAEEGHTDTEIADGRIWIIDPICGTGNIGRGLTCFCTNIALAYKGELIASCVIDYSQNDYFWSIGGGTIYQNESVFVPKPKAAGLGVVIDIDMGAATKLDAVELQKYASFVSRFIKDTPYMGQSLDSSLGFMYTAIGKLDGFLNVYNHPWDICAAAFLIKQAGGVITELDGSIWNIQSVGAVAAGDEMIHKKLLETYNH